jgi:hypothetical protein
MVKCLRDGRHFRGFVGDKIYVEKLLEHLEAGNIKPPAYGLSG